MAVLQRHKSNIYGLVTDLTNLQNNIDAEVLRATGVEGTLTNLTTTDKTNLVNAINEVKGLAGTGTQAVQDALDAEVLRATGVEGTLRTDLDAEILRATGAESDLDSRLDVIEAGLVSGIFWKASFDTLAELETALSANESTIESGWAYYVKADNDGYVVVGENDGDYIPTSWTTKSLIKFADYTETAGLINTEKLRAEAAELALQTEINDTQNGAGLETNGSYLADALTNYLSSATSLKDADKKLDAAIKALDDDTYSKSETDNLIAGGGAEFVTETLTVIADKITLSYAPKNGMIFNFGTVRHVDSNFVSYDIPVTVTATAGGKEFLLSADASGQFDSKSVIVQYAYIPVV
jgi:hypothetical protein